MSSIYIVLVSTSDSIASELGQCLAASEFSDADLRIEMRIETLDGLTSTQAEGIRVILLDAASLDGPVSDAVKTVRRHDTGSLIMVLFPDLDEEAAASVIRAGATSFALHGNLPTVVTALRKHLGTSEEIPTSQALPNSHQILKAFLEESTDSIWVKDRHGKYLLINPAGARFLGKPIDDIIGRTDYEVFPPETAMKVRASDQGVMRVGETQTIEDLLITLDGTPRTFQAVKGVFRDEAGEIQGVIGTVRDVTVRRKIEIALQQSEQRFRLLVEGVKDHAIYMLDTEGNISTWNTGAERLQGYTTKDILGRHFSCLFTEEDQQVQYPGQLLSLALQHGCHEQEMWYVRRDGSRYWANSIITPLFDESFTLIGYSNVVRDMTERKKSEERLRYYAAQLEQSNRELEQFAFIASHDLQAPLRKVKIFSEMLGELAGPDGKDTALRLQASVRKMQQFITDLLSLSRTNRKGKPFRMVDLNAVIAGALDSLELNIRECRAIVTVEQCGSVYGDDAQLEQLFQNLIGNSLKYCKADCPPEIRIRGEALMNGFYQILVQDNGIGFKEEYLERIFRPFERLHGDNQYGGTGMGLAICKKIIERHGGQITATSQQGQGATFIIYLPAQAPKKQNAAKGAEMRTVGQEHHSTPSS